MYNCIPHCTTTEKIPSELFNFGRYLRDNLPSIPNIPTVVIDEKVQDKDKLKKAKGIEATELKSNMLIESGEPLKVS